ncbi:unnamed protein product [Urochloa decumbens]|uniref:F-box domain-containing protein n=1 Tax=Urochloa decumbens TaxID=240449 RepID=A0ABC9B316_9POAL
MAAAAAPLRCHLSDFPDELLLRILSFLPARDATAAAVLSRRWRSLWLSSGVVYLDSRSFGRSSWQTERNFSSYERRTTQCEDCKGFLRAAAKALAAAAAAAPITRLTFVAKIDSLICRPDVLSDDRDLLAAVLSNPAVRRVEELHVEVEHWSGLPLRFASLPSESLRVLRAVNCSPVAAPAAAAFPRLAELHLHDCNVPLVELQPIVHAAPQLATLHLESCRIREKEEVSYTPPGMAAQVYRLVCPAVTALVFESCDFEISVELDAPRLQSFRYMGAVQLCDRLSLNPIRPISMIQVANLHLTEDHNAIIGRGQVCIPSLFWRFIRNFRTAKVLRLKLDFSMDRIALEMIQDNDMLDGHTILFRNLKRLDLDAQYTLGNEASSMVTLANLLHGSPVVHDLRLKLRRDMLNWMNKPPSVDQEARADFNKSVDRFRHRRTPMRSQLGGEGHHKTLMHSHLGGEEDDNDYKASDIIPVLSEQSFNCLDNSLRRASLHSCMDKSNCLGVQLAKFFAKNARVLEEMHIDDGSHKMCEHMNASVSEMG